MLPQFISDVGLDLPQTRAGIERSIDRVGVCGLAGELSAVAVYFPGMYVVK